MKKWILSLVAGLILAPFAVLADAGADAILGAWHTTDDQSVVEVFKANDHYAARIVSLKEPNWPADDELGMGGKPRTDRKNPQPELRHRKIAGLQFMSGFVHAGKNLWEDGKIYDPEIGKTYKCKLTLVAKNKLEVRGFIGISLLGRTVTWTR